MERFDIDTLRHLEVIGIEHENNKLHTEIAMNDLTSI